MELHWYVDLYVLNEYAIRNTGTILGKAYIIGTYLKIGGCEKGNIGFFPCQIRKNTPKSKG